MKVHLKQSCQYERLQKDPFAVQKDQAEDFHDQQERTAFARFLSSRCLHPEIPAPGAIFV